MSKLVQASEATAAQRRVYFHLVDATDGMTPETGEAAGQPQISTNGAAWTNTGIGTLSAIGNGRYYADLTSGAVATAGDFIETRYKSAATAECPGESVQVVGFNPSDLLATGIGSHSLTVTVNDGAAAILGAGVYMRDASTGALLAQGTTAADGTVALPHEGGSVSILVARDGYTFPATAKSLTAGVAATETISGTTVSVTPSADPDECVLYATLRNGDGSAAVGVVGTLNVYRIPQEIGSAFIGSRAVQATSDATGLIQWTAPQTANVWVEVPNYIPRRAFAVPGDATANLTALVHV